MAPDSAAHQRLMDATMALVAKRPHVFGRVFACGYRTENQLDRNVSVRPVVLFGGGRSAVGV